MDFFLYGSITYICMSVFLFFSAAKLPEGVCEREDAIIRRKVGMCFLILGVLTAVFGVWVYG